LVKYFTFGTERRFVSPPPGVSRDGVPDEDALDGLWRTYYRSIFNPALLKVGAMQSEAPKKYWRNLPEVPLIAVLIADSRKRAQTMLETWELPVLRITMRIVGGRRQAWRLKGRYCDQAMKKGRPLSRPPLV
jgi:DNA polymerase